VLSSQYVLKSIRVASFLAIVSEYDEHMLDVALEGIDFTLQSSRKSRTST
jgi:hypothetical protein